MGTPPFPANPGLEPNRFKGSVTNKGLFASQCKIDNFSAN
jgi:hypothetical protein